MKLSGHFRLLFSLTQPTSDTMIGFKVSRILLAANQNTLQLVLEFLEATHQNARSLLHQAFLSLHDFQA